MSVKITKEKILDIAFEIVRTNGIENLSNRTIAKELMTIRRLISTRKLYELNNKEHIFDPSIYKEASL